MRTLLVLALLALPAAADTGPRYTDPVLPAEKLGDSWSNGASGEDRGLAIQAYFNHTLNRDEAWHYTSEGEWFVRVRDGLYVKGVQTEDGHWETLPKERLVCRNGAWRRLHLR